MGDGQWGRDYDANIAELDFDNVLATQDILDLQVRFLPICDDCCVLRCFNVFGMKQVVNVFCEK